MKRTVVVCDVCKGRGWIPRIKPKALFPEERFVKDKCLKCKGRGILTKEIKDKYSRKVQVKLN